MKMFSLSRRDKFYNESDVYECTPVVRIPVVPGMSVDFEIMLKMQSAAFTSNLLSGGLIDLFLFYCPNRLLWDDWVPFIAQDDDYSGTFPVTTDQWDFVFDRNGSSKSALFRRAYKLAYNQYFGDKDVQALGANDTAWFADITTDTNNDRGAAINNEQWQARLVRGDQLADPTYPVASPIPLNDFYRQMMNARSQRKAGMSGDKYVDALRRMGVELDWRVQNAPEKLCRISGEFKPVKVFNTATNTGDSVARFETTLHGRCPRKMFAEHGYIVGIAVVRPFIFDLEYHIPMDGLAVDLEDFYLADNLRDQDTIEQNQFAAAAAASEWRMQRFAYLRNGHHLTGEGSSWVANWSPFDGQQSVFPNGDAVPVGDELGSEQVAFYCEVHSQGATPVPPNAL